MLDHWPVDEGNDGFGYGDSQGTHASAITSNKNQGFHFSDFKERVIIQKRILI